MAKYIIYVEVRNLHSYEGEFANEHEAYNYATKVNQEQDVQTTDGWVWDDGVFDIYNIEEEA